PAGSSLGLGIAIWDSPSGSDHELHLGLRLATPAATAPGWQLSLDVDLLTFALPSSAAMRPGLVGGVALAAKLLLPSPTGAPVTAEDVSLDVSWSPGAPLAVTAAIAGVTVTVDGGPVTI